MNKRGYMHPLSKLSENFVIYSASANASVVDMGSAYGNATLAALTAGAKTVIACDMEEEHLTILSSEAKKQALQKNLITKKGNFPDGFDFPNHSIAAIHASHILEYLDEKEIDRGLRHFYNWLQPGGKLFIICYSIHIAELANGVFQQQYQK